MCTACSRLFWRCLCALHVPDCFWRCICALHVPDCFWRCICALHVPDCFWRCICALQVKDMNQRESTQLCHMTVGDTEIYTRRSTQSCHMVVRGTGLSTQSCHMAVRGTEIQGGPLSHVIWLWEVDLQRYRAVHSVMAYGCGKYRDTRRSTQSCHMAVGGRSTEVQGGPLSHVIWLWEVRRYRAVHSVMSYGCGR